MSDEVLWSGWWAQTRFLTVLSFMSIPSSCFGWYVPCLLWFPHTCRLIVLGCVPEGDLLQTQGVLCVIPPLLYSALGNLAIWSLWTPGSLVGRPPGCSSIRLPSAWRGLSPGRKCFLFRLFRNTVLYSLFGF